MKKIVDIELTGAKTSGFSLAANENENLLNCRDILFGESERSAKTDRQERAEEKEAAKLESTAMMIGLSGFAAMIMAFVAFLF